MATRIQRAVEKLARSRDDSAADRDVESAVRVAGGFPTLGGGLRSYARALRRAGLRAVASPAPAVVTGGVA